MTSRSLFFKLMKEDLKQKLWAFGLAFLSFFFWMPVMTAMRISNLHELYQNWIKNGTEFSVGVTAEMRLAEKLLDLAHETIGFGNPLTAVTIVGAAIVLALTGFMYLHSRKQVDFYHSIPVRRELLFFVKYLDGIVIVATTYLINLVLACAILAMNQVAVSVIVPTALITFLVQMGGFLINYGLMTIAVMLTGNFFISILGGIVLFAYIPSVLALVQGLMFLFFETISSRAVNFEEAMLRTSPIVYYILMVSEGAQLELHEYGTMMGYAGVCLAAGAVMTVAAMFLYRKRPSESAGKSMAFQAEKAPIKILLVVPITIAMALFFWNIYYSLPWAAFGFVMGLIVTHCLIEIIYHFEFRKLFSNLHHMAISAVIALAVIGVFRFDLIGYDRYIPKESQLVSASIYPMNLRDWNDYGHPMVKDTDYGVNYNWYYEQGADYAIGNMEITDQELIRTLAEAGIREAERVKELKYHDQDDTMRGEGFWTKVEIGYRLKNGKTVFREYMMNVTAMREAYDRLYALDAYKEGVYPVLSYTMDNLTGIYEYRQGDISAVEADESMQQWILETYQRELRGLTLEERSIASPVTALRFLTIAEEEYLCYVSADRMANYTGGFRIQDMADVNFFPVYPSFTETIALLEETGVEDMGGPKLEDIARIEVYSDYYLEELGEYEDGDPYAYEFIGKDGEVTVAASAVPVRDMNGEQILVIYDDDMTEMDGQTRAQIDEVMDAMVDKHLAGMNNLQPLERGLTVRVAMKDENRNVISGHTYDTYLFPADQIPEFVKDAFQYDKFQSHQVDYGLNGKPAGL